MLGCNNPPGRPPTLLTSLYSPPDAITRRPLIEINLSRLLSRYPYHVVEGDFNCIRNPHLDSLDADSNPWAWVTSKTSGSNPSWIDTYRHMHSTALGWTRPASKNRLDYIFASRASFMTKKLLTLQFSMVIALPTTTLSQHNCTHPSSPRNPPHPPVNVSED